MIPRLFLLYGIVVLSLIEVTKVKKIKNYYVADGILVYLGTLVVIC